MEYIDCFDLLSIDSIILNDPNCHNIRQYDEVNELSVEMKKTVPKEK